MSWSFDPPGDSLRYPEGRNRMRPLRFLPLLLLLAGPLAAQETLEEKYEAKLLKPFVKKIEWQNKIDAAMELAKKRNRLVLAYFTRSYAP